MQLEKMVSIVQGDTGASEVYKDDFKTIMEGVDKNDRKF